MRLVILNDKLLCKVQNEPFSQWTRDLGPCYPMFGGHRENTGGGGGGGWSLLEINLFVGEMEEVNKWPQGMVEVNIFPTKVEINII